MATSINPLPAPFDKPDVCARLIAQGAESLLYKTVLYNDLSSSSDRETGQTVALKVRPRKEYRHILLDRRLTKARLLAEARVLVRCRRDGVLVPAVLAADWESGWLAIEWIDGWTVRDCLDWIEKSLPVGEVESGQEKVGLDVTVDPDGMDEEQQSRAKAGEWASDDRLIDLIGKVGRAIGRLHSIGVVHGDLTTSNLMLSPDPTGRSQSRQSDQDRDVNPVECDSDRTDVVIIDFGLASQTQQDEDRAVDLYVLERAFASTHPRLSTLFDLLLLPAYVQGFINGSTVVKNSKPGKKQGGTNGGGNAKSVLRKLEDVRLRGRKKSMLG